MSDRSYAEALRALCRDYYAHHISFSEYRARRKVVLDEMDAEFNGWHRDETTSLKADASLVKKAAGLFRFKNTNDQ